MIAFHTRWRTTGAYQIRFFHKQQFVLSVNMSPLSGGDELHWSTATTAFSLSIIGPGLSVLFVYYEVSLLDSEYGGILLILAID